MAKVFCPNCGSEVALPETSKVGIGMTISKQSNGNFALPLETIKNDNLNSSKLNKEENKTMNRENRMETLKVNGVDVGKYFDVALPGGGSVRMMLNESGVPVVANETNDPILNQIIEDGYVRNTKLHRRWVMAQMFKMLNYHSWRNGEEGYDAYLRNHYGYMYQFDMMLEEVRVLSKLEDRDIESFNERSHFFTKDVVIATCKDYLEKLKANIDAQKPKNCKGVPYKRVKGRNIFVADLDKKVYAPVQRQIWMISRARNYKELYKELKKFNDSMINLPWNTKKCKVWIDAFKGSGAYYTLKNLVMYHDCYVKVDKYDSRTGVKGVVYIQSKLNEYQGEGWRYMAMLKKCIADNGFDFQQRMKEIYNK